MTYKFGNNVIVGRNKKPYILSLEDKLIQSCKPFEVPSPEGISEWIIPLPAVIHCTRIT
jgi:hypothetical protein